MDIPENRKQKAGSAKTVVGFIALRRPLERQRIDPEEAGDFFDQPRVWVAALYRPRESPGLDPELSRQLLLGVYPMLEHQYSELPLVQHRKVFGKTVAVGMESTDS
jgi:hypothetical protein